MLDVLVDAACAVFCCHARYQTHPSAKRRAAHRVRWTPWRSGRSNTPRTSRQTCRASPVAPHSRVFNTTTNMAITEATFTASPIKNMRSARCGIPAVPAAEDDAGHHQAAERGDAAAQQRRNAARRSARPRAHSAAVTVTAACASTTPKASRRAWGRSIASTLYKSLQRGSKQPWFSRASSSASGYINSAVQTLTCRGRKSRGIIETARARVHSARIGAFTYWIWARMPSSSSRLL